MVKTALLAVAFAALSVVADVTISVIDVPPLPLRNNTAVTSAADLWAKSCPEQRPPSTPYNASLLLSSYTAFGEDADAQIFPQGTIYPSSDSLVRGVLEAWTRHQHLVLRPDEVWFEVLVQLNYYMTAHAEDVRHLFVDFSGQETIFVKEFTWRDVIGAFADEIQKRVKTEWLKAWIMPGFSTSNENDGLTATVLMMGLMKQYFHYEGEVECGLPRVTLLGQREDWAQLLAKLDRLPEFGKEPEQYAQNLRPIFTRFVQTFDEAPLSEDLKSFWGQIVWADFHIECVDDPSQYDISGWIMGFQHWNENGKLRVPETPWMKRAATSSPRKRSGTPMTLDGITYVPQPMYDLKAGYASVPLKMVDFPVLGTNTSAFLVAGNVGVNRTEDNGSYVRAQPLSSWFMYGPVDPDAHTTAGVVGSLDEMDNMYDGMVVQASCPKFELPPGGDGS